MVMGERLVVIYLDPKGRQWQGDRHDRARSDWTLTQMRRASGSRPLYRVRIIPKPAQPAEA